ncbi:MAG TPA: helix-turn-helix domain-containing protein [Verrucomicrobiae bacterium]|nr:helix-turn-helix domain-containing protein [Verrucomicrobiae bacterium]
MTNSWSGWASNDDPGRFPASVYARGYLRTYASYLGLSAEELVRRLPAEPRRPSLALGLEGARAVRGWPSPRPAVAAAAVVLLAGSG